MKLVSFAAVILLLAASVLVGQDARPAIDRVETTDRPNLLRELGLSPDQIQQMRRLNSERRPQMQVAQQRLRDANRALDAAIYADTVNEAEVQSRLKEFQAAQAEVARIRFQSELAVRRVLTPDQLARFRDLRRRFAEIRDNIQQHRRALRRRPPFRAVDKRRGLPPDN